MKFKFEKAFDRGPEIATLMLFDGGPKLCLCIRTKDPCKFIWMYEDGDITVQGAPPDNDGDVVRRFYPGDSITLTF